VSTGSRNLRRCVSTLLQINPSNGPVQGGTRVTITGVNLGQSYNEIRNGVSIKRDVGDVMCIVDETGSYNPSLVVCTLQSTSEPGAGLLRVNIQSTESLFAESGGNFSILVRR